MLEAKNLFKQYNKKTVVQDVNLKVKQGEIVGLLGPNGAGKTTTFYMIVGIVLVDKGKIFLEKNNITKLPMHKRAYHGIGYLPQETSIFRKLSVEENILVLWELLAEIPKKEYKERLDKLFTEFKIGHLRKQKGYELSGGEKRRVEIARAIALNPKFLLLDEPFAGIDPISISDIQGIINYLKESGIGILITDHNVRETLSITDRSYIVSKGQILLSGNSYDIANDKEAKKIYLGEDFKL